MNVDKKTMAYRRMVGKEDNKWVGVLEEKNFVRERQ
jgi:hypothetical protein